MAYRSGLRDDKKKHNDWKETIANQADWKWLRSLRSILQQNEKILPLDQNTNPYLAIVCGGL